MLQQIILLCVFQDRGDIRSDEALALSRADDQRAFAPHGVDAVRAVAEQDAQREAASDLRHGRGDGAERVAGVMRVKQLRDNFGIGIGDKGSALCDELLFDLLVIFNDAVMDERDLLAASVRVRIDIRGFAVGGPAGVPDADRALRAADGIHFIGKICELNCIVDNNSDAGGVIAAVFQLGKPVQQHCRTVALSDIANDSTHIVKDSFLSENVPDKGRAGLSAQTRRCILTDMQSYYIMFIRKMQVFLRKKQFVRRQRQKTVFMPRSEPDRRQTALR